MEPTKAEILEENARLQEFAESVHDLACSILGVDDDAEDEEEEGEEEEED